MAGSSIHWPVSAGGTGGLTGFAIKVETEIYVVMNTDELNRCGTEYTDLHDTGKGGGCEREVKNVPRQPGVYMFKDENDKVLYVGKARSLRSRMRSYFSLLPGWIPRFKAMMAKVTDFDYIVTANEVEALILESNLIKSYHPRYNIMLRMTKAILI